MDIENIDLCHYGRGELIDLCEQLRAQNARLQSIIDEANAQEPVGYMVRGSFFYSKVQAEKSADHLTANYENTDVINVYVDPIPAQQSVDRDTIINVLLSIGNMSEGIIADAIISAIGALQSPAVAVPDCDKLDVLIDELRDHIAQPPHLQSEEFIKGCLHSLDVLKCRTKTKRELLSKSPRITEQDASEIINSAINFMYETKSRHSIDYWMHEEGLALLAKLNKPDSVGG